MCLDLSMPNEVVECNILVFAQTAVLSTLNMLFCLLVDWGFQMKMILCACEQTYIFMFIDYNDNTNKAAMLLMWQIVLAMSLLCGYAHVYVMCSLETGSAVSKELTRLMKAVLMCMLCVVWRLAVQCPRSWRV